MDAFACVVDALPAGARVLDCATGGHAAGLTPQFSTYTDEDERYMVTARRLDLATGAVDPAVR